MRSSSGDFVPCELAAVEHFEPNLQKEHDAHLHYRMHALQMCVEIMLVEKSQDAR